ncbi:MAG: hypothetical protein K0R49_1519 [Burkholderiales bacterium]|nr:hypothetical protein [Burkholderiales bacterium]
MIYLLVSNIINFLVISSHKIFVEFEMKKFVLVMFISILSLFYLNSCSNGGGSSSPPANINTDAFSISAIDVQLNNTAQLNLSITGGNAKNILFTISSSDTNIVKVTPDNCTLSAGPGLSSTCQLVLSGIALGSATITASAPGFSTISAKVTVGSAPVITGTSAFSRTSVSVALNNSADLGLAITSGSAQGVLFTISSSNTSIVQVSPPNCSLSAAPGAPTACQLTVSGLALGSATITASAPGFNTVTATVTVGNTPVPGILVFSKPTESVVVGGNNHVTLSLLNSSGESIVAGISSSDSSVFTTDPASCNLSSGAANSCDISLNGINEGSATITATSPTKNSATMNVDVNGFEAIVFGTIVFDKTTINLSPGASLLDQLSLNNSSGIVNDTVTLTSGNTNIATVTPATCILSSDISLSSCAVTIKGISSGTTSITATSIYSGYTYSITPVSVHVGSALNFSTTVTGISQTVYTGQGYNAGFIFTNNSSEAVTLGNMVITNTGNKISSPIDPAPCSNKTIPAGGTCTININNVTLPANQELAHLNFLLVNANSNDNYSYNMDIAAVVNIPNYAAFRVINYNNPGHQGWLVALGNGGNGQAVVKFDASGKGSLLPSSASYAQGQIAIPGTPFGLVIYQPNYGAGIGGLMYVSLDSPVYEPHGNIGVPSATPGDPNENINFSVYEPNVYDQGGGKLAANLDITAINSYGVMQGFYATDINSQINMGSGFLNNAYESLPTTTIYSQIRANLTASWPTSWGSESQFAFNTTNPAQWVGLRGLANWIGQSPSIFPQGFSPDTYTRYVKDLWTYYAQSGHHILIGAGEIYPWCVLEATVDSPNTMSVHPRAGSNCPETDRTGPNSFKWTKFQAIDFVGGAPSSASTLWGPNGTYRSMGKFISAAQSVGFLPYCTQPDIVYDGGIFNTPAYQAKYWTAQYSCLSNYDPSKGGYGDSVMNQYDKILHQYVPLIYTWAYDDVLGISSEVNIDPAKSVFTLVLHQFNP